MNYIPAHDRYQRMQYSHCGNTGLELPKLSLGLWHNFGSVDVFDTAKSILLHAFDNGITHFDLANNYGPVAGSAEKTLGAVLSKELVGFRDELIISTKAGYGMWEGPYGDGGSKKYLIASLNQSLKRMNLEYVDIFYHHRFDPRTPLEETMAALELIYRQGKALYIGISNYNSAQTNEAVAILQSLGVPLVLHQFKYNMFCREAETDGLLQTLEQHGVGSIAFSPLAQGLLSDKYLHDIPRDSRAAKPHGFLSEDDINEEVREKIQALTLIAQNRNQTLAEMAIAWLWHKKITSVLIGASSLSQLQTNLNARNATPFLDDEIRAIDAICL